MSAIERLSEAGALCATPSHKLYVRTAEDSARVNADAAAAMQPLVSCLVVTRGKQAILWHSLTCYKRQTYQLREAIIVVDSGAPALAVQELVTKMGLANSTKVVPTDHGTTLGERRNSAACHARGAILVVWDDDDLYHPRRIATAVDTLMASGAAAAFQSRLLIWWPARRLTALTCHRLWEGTMAIWRKHMRLYPAISLGEDTKLVESLIDSHPIAEIDTPLDYIYVVNGSNSWNESHFEFLISVAERVFKDEEHDELTEFLASDLPILEYRSVLGNLHG